MFCGVVMSRMLASGRDMNKPYFGPDLSVQRVLRARTERSSYGGRRDWTRSIQHVTDPSVEAQRQALSRLAEASWRPIQSRRA